MEGTKQYSPYISFVSHFNALARVGYYKLVPNEGKKKEELSRRTKYHELYRIAAFSLILLYNLQHIIKVIQARHSTEQIVDTLFVLLTTVNTLGKQLAFNLRSRRIDLLMDTVKGPFFAPTDPYHVNVMKRNASSMSRLLKLYHVAIFICGSLWAIYPLVNRAMDVHVEFTAYFPFDTNKSPIFEFVLAYMSIMVTFQAYGNVTMDCTIVSLYAQGTIQLKVLRNDLENLAKGSGNGCKIYKDLGDGGCRDILHRRFVACVERYREIVRFIKEVESIFDEAMVLQFFLMAWVLCMTVYKIVGLNLLSAEFISMAVYLGCMLAQLFIYCYYGTTVIFESGRVNESLYSGPWLDLSPRFRKQLLVFMTRCNNPIVPRAAYIIPLSLDTYKAVLKMSYTLFTFLDQKS